MLSLRVWVGSKVRFSVFERVRARPCVWCGGGENVIIGFFFYRFCVHGLFSIPVLYSTPRRRSYPPSPHALLVIDGSYLALKLKIKIKIIIKTTACPRSPILIYMYIPTRVLFRRGKTVCIHIVARDSKPAGPLQWSKIKVLRVKSNKKKINKTCLINIILIINMIVNELLCTNVVIIAMVKLHLF